MCFAECHLKLFRYFYMSWSTASLCIIFYLETSLCFFLTHKDMHSIYEMTYKMCLLTKLLSFFCCWAMTKGLLQWLHPCGVPGRIVLA